MVYEEERGGNIGENRGEIIGGKIRGKIGGKIGGERGGKYEKMKMGFKKSLQGQIFIISKCNGL